MLNRAVPLTGEEHERLWIQKMYAFTPTVPSIVISREILHLNFIKVSFVAKQNWSSQREAIT